MNRDQFFAKLAALDEEGLRKALWNLYWRGAAEVRERIEAQIDPEVRERRRREADVPPDPGAVFDEVLEFVQLAQAGAYLGGDRRVSPKERTRWRFTFRRLADDALRTLDAEDIADGADAVELLVDLACETRGYEYFRSEDPMEAARFVVSDAVALLWKRLREHHGFAGFAERAAPQLIRWEAAYGWTRSGAGTVADKEVSLASVLAGMLTAQDMWLAFAERYVDALAELAATAETKRRRRRDAEWAGKERARALAEWHAMLIDRLVDSEADGLLDRLAEHPALAGPERTFIAARTDAARGETDRARDLVAACLKQLPGHRDFIDLAKQIGAELPPRSRDLDRAWSR